MADKSELRMNLAAIKRVDPYAKDIIDSSAHVAFYTFNPDETEWEKTDVEGAFFVYSRNAEPYHSVFINNRLNTNSLVEPITPRIELQNQTPFLLYRNERSRIRGFWFYNRTECDRIGELVERIVKECEPVEAKSGGDNTSIQNNLMGTSLPSQQPLDLMTYSNSNVDIFSMLSKAQQDFNNSLTIPNAKSNNTQGLDASVKALNNEPIAIEKLNLLPSTNAATPIPIPSDSGTSQSVMNFFAAAKPAKPKEVPFLQRMLSAPVHIDQIEKQHRANTPLKEKHSPTQARGQPPLLAHSVQTTYAKNVNNENGLSFMRIHSPTQQQQQQKQKQQTQSIDLGTSPLATFIASNNLSANSVVACGSGGGASGVVGTKDILKSSQATDIKEIESHHQHPEPLKALLKKPVPVSASNAVRSNNLIGSGLTVGATTTTATTPHKPALMPPTMFKSSADSPGNQKSGGVSSNNSLKGKSAIKPGGDIIKENNTNNTPKKCRNFKEMMPTRMVFMGSTLEQQQKQTEQAPPIVSDVQPLTQTQLSHAISYLMKNDPDFVKKIHEAYLKSFAEMVSQ